jgi:hypothetical protein
LAERLLDLRRRRRALFDLCRLIGLVCAAARSSYCFSSTAVLLYLGDETPVLLDQYPQFAVIIFRIDCQQQFRVFLFRSWKENAIYQYWAGRFYGVFSVMIVKKVRIRLVLWVRRFISIFHYTRH